jgi:hypothetical protein
LREQWRERSRLTGNGVGSGEGSGK